MNIFSPDPYEYLIDFIQAAIDSEDLNAWLINLEKIPGNLRWQHLKKIKDKMIQDDESKEFIKILELLDNKEILYAINAVIKDINHSGMKAKNAIN